MKTIVIAALLFCCCLTGFASERSKAETDWLATNYAKLAAVWNLSAMTNVGYSYSSRTNQDGYHRFFPNDTGLLMLPDSSWVILVSHSIHAGDGLGDLTLMRTSDGRYFLNQGHVCAQLSLLTKGPIASLQDLLNAKSHGEKGLLAWEPYQSGQAAKGRGQSSKPPSGKMQKAKQ